MIRKIIHIDREKCNGCGLCVRACHEGAIGMQKGKAILLRDDYCDGLGDCLPSCPTGAISFEEREALPYDDEAVRAHLAASQTQPPAGGCPGKTAVSLRRAQSEQEDGGGKDSKSRLNQWPVQIKLVPVGAPYFHQADLLIAADCTAFACGDFHSRLMKGRITLIGCPKLDSGDYAEKLTAIFKNNDIRSITVARMEVPCCGGLSRAVEQALKNSGKNIPVRAAVIGIDGQVEQKNADSSETV